jgi:CheY-like chemotaxis protein
MVLIHNILIIDDNEMDNYISERLLKKHRIADEVTVRTSALDGLHYLDELQRTAKYFPEVILLDVNMPAMDGFEFLETFSHYPRKLINKSCVIVLSSSSDPKDIHKAKRSRFVKDYFIKPLTTEKIETISKLCLSVHDH